MKKLSNILEGVQHLNVIGDLNQPIAHLSIDSRNSNPNALFFAIKGTHVDGHSYIQKAIENGAKAIVCEVLPVVLNHEITYVLVENASESVGLMAANFFDHPSRSLKVIGVTGTNGKTTVATLLYQLFEGLGYPSGLLSTVQNHIHNKVLPSTHTTPNAIAVQELLAKMKEEGCMYAFMEVSSHAVHQHRINGVHFVGAIFTNITHDHLDYHGTFDEYIKVKKAFFDHLNQNCVALTNIDDKRGAVMLQNTKAQKLTYSIRQDASFKGKIIDNSLHGLQMYLNDKEAHFRLMGIFNAYNLLSVYGMAVSLGQNADEVLQVLSNLKGATGRFETYLSSTDRIIGIVDYAHTPDALLNVLATIKHMNAEGRNVLTIVGCGGDRDAEKRPLMAQIAVEYSNRVILTSDNPRSEDPEDILNEMEAGLDATQKRKVLRITDRSEAIKTACVLAQPEDIILIAGKGHETYQEIRGIKHPFDDAKILMNHFQMLNK